MTFEIFRAMWSTLQLQSRLRAIGAPEETVNTESLERAYSVEVLPAHVQLAKPFEATARFQWRWDALLTQRTRLLDENVLEEMWRRTWLRAPRTTSPSIHIGVVMTASMPYGKPMPMPARAAWRSWVRDSRDSLARVGDGGSAASPRRHSRPAAVTGLVWERDPLVTTVCNTDGELLFGRIELAGSQVIELPWHGWDGAGPEHDEEGPDREAAALTAMFAHVRDSLHAWMVCLQRITAPGRSVRKRVVNLDRG